jgi:hypothetical protein
MKRALGLAFILMSVATSVAAFSQDRLLEAALARSDAQALARLPAQGFKDGVAGFFRTHRLVVVPGSEMAWCQTNKRGVLVPGCYVEFVFQASGRARRIPNGDFCGLIGRWFQLPGTKRYVPTPGATYSLAMARGDWEAVISALDEPGLPAQMSDAHRIAACAAPDGEAAMGLPPRGSLHTRP